MKHVRLPAYVVGVRSKLSQGEKQYIHHRHTADAIPFVRGMQLGYKGSIEAQLVASRPQICGRRGCVATER
jgi:hypothetical protein